MRGMLLLAMLSVASTTKAGNLGSLVDPASSKPVVTHAITAGNELPPDPFGPEKFFQSLLEDPQSLLFQPRLTTVLRWDIDADRSFTAGDLDAWLDGYFLKESANAVYIRQKDVNGDRRVNILDFELLRWALAEAYRQDGRLLEGFGFIPPPGYVPAKFDGDSVVLVSFHDHRGFVILSERSERRILPGRTVRPVSSHASTGIGITRAK